MISFMYRLYEIFPAMTPRENTSAFRYLQELLPHLEPGAGRSPAEQAGFQMATVVMCFVVPVIGGILTGTFVINHLNIPTIDLTLGG